MEESIILHITGDDTANVNLRNLGMHDMEAQVAKLQEYVEKANDGDTMCLVDVLNDIVTTWKDQDRVRQRAVADGIMGRVTHDLEWYQAVGFPADTQIHINSHWIFVHFKDQNGIQRAYLHNAVAPYGSMTLL